MSDLIAAVATANAPAAIGILRLSGAGALAAADRVFRPAGGTPLSQAGNRQLCYGALLDREGAVIDHILATVSRGPHSYTGEDTAEFQCHGAPMVLSLGLEALYAAGARPAGPGEFTQRAFLNGRLDLTQAEGVADLLQAETPAAARTAAGQLGGALSRGVAEVYDLLVDLSAHFHAVLDYPDEDIAPLAAEGFSSVLCTAQARLHALLQTYSRGKHLIGGAPCAIVGLPNAGKSSLLNALLGYQRAIVTDIPGTTRDTVEERCTLGGVLLRLIDTAGLRETDDPVEQLGVARSRAALAQAELALVLVDGAAPACPEEHALWQDALAQAPHALLVQTKGDLPAARHLNFLGRDGVPAVPISVSAHTGAGLEELGRAVAACFPTGEGGAVGAMLTNARQAQAVEAALNALQTADEALTAGLTPDAVLADIEVAMEQLGVLTGQNIQADVVARIFSRFCVGK